jgi:hypothetical protein
VKVIFMFFFAPNEILAVEQTNAGIFADGLGKLP